MKTILILFSIVSLAIAFGIALEKGTKDFTIPVRTSGDVKAFTRVLPDGKKQTWNLTGANKGTWVDEKGKKVDSSNYVFVAPDKLKIKKVGPSDAALYDYISIHEPVDATPPPGVHIDPGVPSSFDLTVVGKL